MVHSEEEALGTRLTIDSLTCLLANETDPSRLVAVSPGKLMRHLVEEDGQVDKDQPYAEVEVSMRLTQPLVAKHSVLLPEILARPLIIFGVLKSWCSSPTAQRRVLLESER